MISRMMMKNQISSSISNLNSSTKNGTDSDGEMFSILYYDDQKLGERRDRQLWTKTSLTLPSVKKNSPKNLISLPSLMLWGKLM